MALHDVIPTTVTDTELNVVVTYKYIHNRFVVHWSDEGVTPQHTSADSPVFRQWKLLTSARASVRG